MRISLILAHPSKESFNHAIARTAAEAIEQNGHALYFHDLYEESFDPVLRNEEIKKGTSSEDVLERHCVEVASADGIIIVHPNWWGQPPAMLKGWVDRVIRPGVAYKFMEGDSGEGVPVGLLKAKSALIFNTSNTYPERETKVFGDPLESIWKNCVFGLCGVRDVYRRTFGVIVTSTPKQRQEWLREVCETVENYFPREVR